MKRVFALLAFLLIFPVVSIVAQTPSPTPPVIEDNDVVVITTNLIQIDATVTDKKGNIVKNLKPEDFEIYENGKLQQITNFSFVAQTAETASPANSAPEKNNKNAPNVPIQPVRRPEQVQRTIALVVDDLGLSFASSRWVKDALKKFVDEQMQPGDLVAVVRTGSGIGALQQFTSDKRLLYAAIERIRWNTNSRVGVNSFTPIEPNHREQLNGVTDLTGEAKTVTDIQGISEERENDAAQQSFNEDVFAVGTLGAVSFIVRGLRQLPGRKAVMLFSEGFELYREVPGLKGASGGSAKVVNTRLAAAFERLVDQANRSDVVIYSVDPRGVENTAITAQDNLNDLVENESYVPLIENRRQKLLETQQSLRSLADQTGGFAVINNNNINKGIERVLNDQKGYYLVGYQPDDEIFDPEKRRFNKLIVKLKNPDLRVRYRSGFFGIRDGVEKQKSDSARLIDALASPFAANGIELRLTSLFADEGGAQPVMRSLIHIKADDLKFVEDADGWRKAQFEVVAMTFGENGEPVGEIINNKHTIRSRPEKLQDNLKNGLVANISIPVKKPGAYQMRIAIRDEQSGRIGSASQFIEVPDLKKKRLALSGVLLRSLQPQQIKVADPLSEALNVQREAALRKFRSGATIRFDVSVYNAKVDRSTSQPNLVVQHKIFRDGKEIFASAEKPFNLNHVWDIKHMDVSGAFALGKQMQLGDYVLQVIVKDLAAKEKRQIASQWIDFEVTP